MAYGYNVTIPTDDLVNPDTIRELSEKRNMTRGEFIASLIKECYRAQIEAYLNYKSSVHNLERGEHDCSQ